MIRTYEAQLEIRCQSGGWTWCIKTVVLATGQVDKVHFSNGAYASEAEATLEGERALATFEIVGGPILRNYLPQNTQDDGGGSTGF